MVDDRRILDQSVHKEIIDKLDKHGEQLVVIDERQKVVLKRLDTINGTVADYNKNKQKFDKACQKVEILEVEVVKAREVLTDKVVANEALILQAKIEHEKELQKLDTRYVRFDWFRNTAIILGVLITASTIIQIFFSR